MPFLHLSVSINPHFNSTRSCLFSFPCSSTPSFHTFLPSPPMSLLLLLLAPLGSPPPPQSLAFGRLLCPVLPCPHAPVSVLVSSRLCTACCVVADVKRYWLSYLTHPQWSSCLQSSLWGLLRATQATRSINSLTFSLEPPVWMPRDDLQSTAQLDVAASRRFPGRSFLPAPSPVFIYVSITMKAIRAHLHVARLFAF